MSQAAWNLFCKGISGSCVQSARKAGNGDSQDSNECYLTKEKYHQMLFLLSCIPHSFVCSDLSLSLVYILHFYPSVCDQVHPTLKVPSAIHTKNFQFW